MTNFVQVVVRNVKPRSIAQAVGLRAGDALVAVNGREIGQREDAVQRSLSSISGSMAARAPFQARTPLDLCLFICRKLASQILSVSG